jgi:hypothetical protein
LELKAELLLAVKKLILEFDSVTKSESPRGTGGQDCDGSLFYEIEIEELRSIIEAIEGCPWDNLVEDARSTPYHLLRENMRLDAQYARRKEDEAWEAAKAREYRAEKRREREFLKAFLAGGERSRTEIYAAAAEVFPSGFAPSWAGIAKRKEAGVWYWRLK